MKIKFNQKTKSIATIALEKYNCKISINDIQNFYCESHRFFHTCEHINKMFKSLSYMDENSNIFKTMLSSDDYDAVVLSILFHDIIYLPWAKNNEEESIKYMQSVIDCKSGVGLHACKMIQATKDHIDIDDASHILNFLDTEILSSKSISELIEYENQIFKEFKYLDLNVYIESRIDFLEKFLQSSIEPNDKLNDLIDYIKNRQYNIALYAGSFNPFHKGHLDILEKAEEMFDKVIVVQGVNSAKNKNEFYGSLRNVEELKSREIIVYPDNIILHFMKKSNIAKFNPVLIRGIRDSSDISHESNYIQFCKELHYDLRVCLIFGEKPLSHISSSAMRDLATVAPEIYDKYIVE